MDDPIAVTVFGGLQVLLHGQKVQLQSPRVRTVLGILTLADEAPVRLGDLIEALWESDPPSSAANQVHRLIGQIRHILEPRLSPRATGSFLRLNADAYSLVLPPKSSDLRRFRDAVAKGRRAAPDSALECYLEALDVAAQPPLPEFERSSAVGARAAVIESERLTAFLDAADIALTLGPVNGVLGHAPRFGALHPLDEAVQARVIRLLTRSGRRSEALALARTAQSQLRAELGVDAVREVQAALLEALRADAGPEDGLSTSPLPPPPTAYRGHVRRVAEEATLSSAAEAAAAEGGVVVVSGIAGIGKTSLVSEWARTAATRFRDGVLYLDLRGFRGDSAPTQLHDALLTLLRALEVAAEPSTPTDDLLADYRKAAQQRELLLILDNVRDAAQIRPLLPTWSRTLVIVLSRNRLSSLVAREAAIALPIERLSRPESLALLQGRLGRQRLELEPAATDRIIDRCGGLPLALAIVSARGIEGSEGALQELAEELAGARPLNALELDDDEASVRAALTWSLGRLSHGAACLLRGLAVHPSTEASPEAAESLLALDPAETEPLIAELESSALLSSTRNGHLRMHDLVRALAMENLAEYEQRNFQQRIVEHFVRTAFTSFAQLNGLGRLAEAGPESVGPRDLLNDASAANDWYLTERSTIRTVLEFALRNGLDRSAALLVQCLGAPLEIHEGSLVHEQLLEAVLPAALRSGEPSLVCGVERALASKAERKGDMQSADRHWEGAVSAARDSGDLEDLVKVLVARCISALVRPTPATAIAIDYAKSAVEAARRSGGSRFLAGALQYLGTALTMAGRYAEAVAPLLEVESAPGARDHDRAMADTSLAQAYLELKRFPEAASHAQRSAERFGGVGFVADQAMSVGQLALASWEAGDYSRAEAACLEFRALMPADALERQVSLDRENGITADSVESIEGTVRIIERVEQGSAARRR